VAGGQQGKQAAYVCACVCACVALDFCEPVLNLNGFEFAVFFTVVMMRPVLEHGLFKALPGFVMNTHAWCPSNMHVSWDICSLAQPEWL
jgi:hypothetical protein